MVVQRKINGHTRVLGKSQGYKGLSIRDELTDHGPQMVSAWEFTPAEITKLQAGESLYLVVLGDGHPPVNFKVGED